MLEYFRRIKEYFIGSKEPVTETVSLPLVSDEPRGIELKVFVEPLSKKESERLKRILPPGCMCFTETGGLRPLTPEETRYFLKQQGDKSVLKLEE